MTVSNDPSKSEAEMLRGMVAQCKRRHMRLLGLVFAMVATGVAGTVYYENEIDKAQEANSTLQQDLRKANDTALGALSKAIEKAQENIQLHRDLNKKAEAGQIEQLVVQADAMAKASWALCEKEGSNGFGLDDVYHDTARYVEGLGGYTHRQTTPVAQTLSMVNDLQQNNIRVVERNLRSRLNPVLAQWFNSPSYGQVLVVDDLLFSDGQRAVRDLVGDVVSGRVTVPQGQVLALVAEEQDDLKAYPDGYKLRRVNAPIGAEKVTMTSDDLSSYRVKILPHPCPQ